MGGPQKRTGASISHLLARGGPYLACILAPFFRYGYMRYHSMLGNPEFFASSVPL